jgi:multimeric flavodoxin WrbA
VRVQNSAEDRVNIIAFNGSPRKGGNTQILLEEAMRGAKEQGADLTLFDLNALKLRPCQNCGGCDDTGHCVIQDDMQAIHSAIRSADRIIVASPIFFFSVSAQTKIMIDRCQAFWSEKYVHKKPVPPGPAGRKGLLILVGGMKRDAKNKGFECAEATARSFFRTVNVQEHATLEYGSVDKKGEIREDPKALKEAYEAGKALAR